MSARLSAFRVPEFRRITQARFLFALSVQVQAVVMGWQMYEIKRDPLYLGLIGLAEAVPALILALIAGAIVDRGDALKIYRNVLRVSFLSAAILVAVSGPWSPVPEESRAPWIYLAAFVTGMARGFSGPALYSLIPQVIAREVLSVSSAWITSAFQVAAVTGPALGGLLYPWRGAYIPYAFGAAMLLLATLSLSGLRIQPRRARANEREESVMERFGSGFKYVFRHELLLSALALDMFAVLFGGVTAILPLFSGEILNAGPTGLGLLRASPSFGALLMSAILIRSPVGRHAGRILIGVVAGYGVCIIAFGLSRDFWMSAALLAASGALDSVSMVIRGAIVQLCSPDEMRGRVAAVNSVFIGSSNEIGAFESGVAAKLLGTVPSVIFGGSMTLITVMLAAILAPRLRRMDLNRL